MKTTVIESNKAKANGTAAVNNLTSKDKVNGMSVSSAFEDKAKAETSPKNAEEQKNTIATTQSKAEETKTEVPKVETDQTKATPTKMEIKDQLAITKPVLNLEGTLKLVEELHRRKVQRDKLLGTIETLETFDVAQKDDAEETDSNHFQGCELTIEDDKRRQFVTKNPFIIKKVAEYINALCLDKLAEIEGEIYLPA
ncbi:hypothetical protein [Pedobacter alluvionis]|uniref:Uncharacterized protein n=1 Tax=Pedobacter alluvionis TaxID=475253 RepID=A0A497Y6D7_9SPHI|nr:hypothetical protein [Pedobacter alluvionis]RLJ77345.1 hypothetical protein BCL90_2430 [Pedobacter alluvionis]TFB33433.1 hypothetical protein E3V97_05140 [Pedobacter alluvionis]